MEDESVGPGVASTTEASVGIGHAEPPPLVPPRSWRSGRNLGPDRLMIAGVAWRPLGRAQGLVVMARGRGSDRMAGSLATLTVVSGGRDVQVTAPVGAVGGAGSVQTFRFVFRLPPSAPSWPIDRLVLRFMGRDIELDPPGGAAAEGPAGAGVGAPRTGAAVEEPAGAGVGAPPTGPQATPMPLAAVAEHLPPEPSVTGADLAELRADIDDVSRELLRLLSETPAPTVIPAPEPDPERDDERRWLRSVAIHLEQVAKELSECRSQFDRISEHLEAARSATLADSGSDHGGAPSEEVGGEVGGEAVTVGQEAVEDEAVTVGQEAVEDEAVTVGQERAVGEKVVVEETPREDLTAPMPQEIAQALAEFRAELVRQALPEAATLPDGELDAPAHASEVEPVLPPSLPDWVEHEAGQRSWFGVALRRLAERDLEAAGRVLVAMLPAQAVATERYGRYDLIVGGSTIFGVDVRAVDTKVQRLEHRRPLTETGAWITGDFEALGRLVLKGRRTLVSRLRRQAVKVKGKRRYLADLLALIAAPLRLRDLCAVGARVPSDLLLRMIIETARTTPTLARPMSIQFEPGDPEESRCTLILDQSGAHLLGPTAGAPEPTLVVRASSRGLMHLLAGLPSPEDETATVGSPEPMRLLQDCVRGLELETFEGGRTWRWGRRR